jgi:hypothetical protein
VLAAGYEQLRAAALVHRTGGLRGAGVLVAHGMAAWIRACQLLPAPARAVPVRATGPPTGADAGELVQILAEIALSCDRRRGR